MSSLYLSVMLSILTIWILDFLESHPSPGHHLVKVVRTHFACERGVGGLSTKHHVAGCQAPESIIETLVSFSTAAMMGVNGRDEQGGGDMTSCDKPFLKVLPQYVVVMKLSCLCVLFVFVCFLCSLLQLSLVCSPLVGHDSLFWSLHTYTASVISPPGPHLFKTLHGKSSARLLKDFLSFSALQDSNFGFCTFVSSYLVLMSFQYFLPQPQLISRFHNSSLCSFV